MASEAKRGFLRIVSTYVRLAATLSMGIIYVPILIGWLGFEAFGLVSLVASSVGFVNVLRHLTEQSMVRDLGAAYHRDDPEEFAHVYSSSYAVALLFAVIIATGYVILAAVIGLLKIPDAWIGAARVIVLAQGAYAFLLVLLSPAYTMYHVEERFAWSNFWRVLTRTSDLVSALILAFVVGMSATTEAEVNNALIAHGLLLSSFQCIVLIASVVFVAFLSSRRLIPSLALVRRRDIRAVLHTFGWNSTVHLAMGLHEYMAMLLMNLAFGVLGNAVFGIAFRLVSYVRMLTHGVSYGLEAVSARMSSDHRGVIREFIHHSTRLHAFVAFPASLAVYLLVEPILVLWIGKQLYNPELAIADPDAALAHAVVIVRILVIVILARSISDNWQLIMYGAGHVRRYAPTVLAGGVLSPILSGVLLFVLPGTLRFYAPALGYTVVYSIVHFFMLPAIATRCFDVPYASLFTPTIRPLIATALCAPLLFVPVATITWTLPRLAGVCVGFGIVYAVVTWVVVLTAEERHRFGGAARRRLPSVR